MSALQIELPESLRTFVDEQVVAHGYQKVDQYFQRLVELDRNRRATSELETKLAEALEDPSTPMTEADWDNIRETGKRLLKQAGRP